MQSEAFNAQTNPIQRFIQWLQEARANPNIKEPTAMALATSDKNQQPHARVVLCKEFSEDGFTFYTNYTSHKGSEIADNAKVAAVFYWDPLARQIRVEGTVTKTSRQNSEQYWNSRPRESQLSQYISQQSQPLRSRAELEDAHKKAQAEFANRPVPCPDQWGGYVIKPSRFEFWIGRSGRLHERYEFEKSSSGWTFRLLYP